MNRRRNGFTLQSKYLLLILTGLCVLLMAITFMTDIFSGTLAEISSYVTIPFQKGISETGTYLSNRSDELVQIRDLIQQNKELQQQIDELTIENNNLTQEKYELNNLRSLYKLDQEYADYQKTGAKVIGKNSGNWFQSFTIDKGTKDGIKLNMNVMAESGLVGIVTEVGYNWARVTSIIDDSSNVSGMTLATGDNMIVSGNLELMSQNKISFSKLIDSNDQVKEGDKVVTIGGIHGVVSSTKEKTIILKVDDNTKLEFNRSAIASVVNPEPEKKAGDKPAKSEKSKSEK